MKKYFMFVLYLMLCFSIYSYERVASVNLSGDEMLIGLIDKTKIVGLSGKINEDEDMSNISKEAKGIPKIEKNLEILLDLNPDFVLAADWMDKKFIQSIEDMGIKVYLYKTPKNIKEQENLILDLGHELNEDKRAQNLVDLMEKKLKEVGENSGKLSKKYKVMLYTPFETTSDENTSFNDLVNLAGGINPVVGSGITSFQKISKEKVIELNPDIIIVPVWRVYSDNNEFFKYLTEDKSFSEVNAIKNKNIYQIPYKNLSPTSQYMIKGVEVLGDILMKVDSKKK